MSEKIEIKIIIDQSLAEYFKEGIRNNHLESTVEEELTSFLSEVLNDLMFPIISRETGDREISLSYEPKAFADPIF